MTIEEVAARAYVAKTSIYERWPNKGALALDAFFFDFLSQQPPVDTGALESDLRASLDYWAHAVLGTPTGSALVRLVAEAQLDDDLARAWSERVLVPLREQHRRMIDSAIRRGEIPQGSDAEVVMDLTFGAVYHRLFQGHLEITPSFIELVAKTIAEGAKTGATVSHVPRGAQ